MSAAAEEGGHADDLDVMYEHGIETAKPSFKKARQFMVSRLPHRRRDPISERKLRVGAAPDNQSLWGPCRAGATPLTCRDRAMALRAGLE